MKELSHQALREERNSMEEEWGLEIGELETLEEMETAKKRFLDSGPGLCRIGSGFQQTTIRVWSEVELISLQLVKECLKEAFWKSSEETLLAGWKTENDPLLNNDDSTEAELTVTTPGACKQNEIGKHNLNYKFKFLKNTITNYFSKKKFFKLDIEMKALEKERRLEI